MFSELNQGQMSARRVDDEDDDMDTDFIDEAPQEEDDRPTDPRWDALKKLKR